MRPRVGDVVWLPVHNACCDERVLLVLDDSSWPTSLVGLLLDGVILGRSPGSVYELHGLAMCLRPIGEMPVRLSPPI